MTMKSLRRILTSTLLPFAFATAAVASDQQVDQTTEASPREPLAVEIDHPAPDQPIRPAEPRVEVSGRTGDLPFFGSDVVILFDHSTLAAVASGMDVDKDGEIGRTRSSVTHWEPLAPNLPLWTTDPGDTVQEMQLRIAAGLVSRLAARENRVGLVSFTFRAHSGGTAVVRLFEKRGVSVPVGGPEPVLAALADFPAPQERRHTNLNRLLERGVELLEDAPPSGGSSRPRAILLLSHGAPSAPNGVGWSASAAVEYARELGERGIAVWAIPVRGTGTAFLSELSRASGGDVLPLDQLDRQFAVPVTSGRQPKEIKIDDITQ